MNEPTPHALEVIRSWVLRRQEAIEALSQTARDDGKFSSHPFWAMVYDFEKAPKTTDRARLTAIGVEVPSLDYIPVMTDEEVTGKLDELASALGWLRIIVRLPIIPDREALTTLVKALDDEVSDTVGPYCTEYLDLTTEANDSQLLLPDEENRWEGRLPKESDLNRWAPLIVPPPTVPSIA